MAFMRDTKNTYMAFMRDTKNTHIMLSNSGVTGGDTSMKNFCGWIYEE